MTIGTKIRKLRLAHELTQDELAIKIGIESSYISLLENDKRVASVFMYKRIAEILDVPMWKIFCELPEEQMLILEELQDRPKEEVRLLLQLISGNNRVLEAE